LVLFVVARCSIIYWILYLFFSVCIACVIFFIFFDGWLFLMKLIRPIITSSIFDFIRLFSSFLTNIMCTTGLAGSILYFLIVWLLLNRLKLHRFLLHRIYINLIHPISLYLLIDGLQYLGRFLGGTIRKQIISLVNFFNSPIQQFPFFLIFQLIKNLTLIYFLLLCYFHFIQFAILLFYVLFYILTFVYRHQY
jgi:hypothetical protein